MISDNFDKKEHLYQRFYYFWHKMTYTINMETTQTKNKAPYITIFIIVIILAIFGYLAYILLKTDSSSVGKEKVDYSNGLETKYNLNGKNFTLTHPKDVYPMPKDSAQWGVKMENNEITGTLMWYFAVGKERLLTNPYIQVSYVKKTVGASSIDSLYIWLDNTILKSPESKVLRQRFSVPLSNGKILECKEYAWGKRTMTQGQDSKNSSIDSKYVAYIYMDYDSKYWLGYALTTKEKDKFDNYLPSFYYIAKSFEQ